ncbi:hypothetical protein PIB30_101450, partial [Stylosanthes scabra]|nr:hypothetical protein [Stylosanthes scabra]
MARGDQGEAAGHERGLPGGRGWGRGRGQRQPAMRSANLGRLTREVHVVGAVDFE